VVRCLLAIELEKADWYNLWDYTGFCLELLRKPPISWAEIRHKCRPLNYITLGVIYNFWELGIKWSNWKLLCTVLLITCARNLERKYGIHLHLRSETSCKRFTVVIFQCLLLNSLPYYVLRCVSCAHIPYNGSTSGTLKAPYLEIFQTLKMGKNYVSANVTSDLTLLQFHKRKELNLYN
jgi:hypothetical protein